MHESQSPGAEANLESLTKLPGKTLLAAFEARRNQCRATWNLASAPCRTFVFHVEHSGDGGVSRRTPYATCPVEDAREKGLLLLEVLRSGGSG